MIFLFFAICDLPDFDEWMANRVLENTKLEITGQTDCTTLNVHNLIFYQINFSYDRGVCIKPLSSAEKKKH